MGHIRLGRLPKTKQWKRVFDALASPDVDAADLAAATATAASDRFTGLRDDATLQECVWILARLASASKGEDFVAEIARLGMDPARASSGTGLIAETARVVRLTGGQSALSEIAVRSIQGVLAERLVDQSRSLFGGTIADVQAAVADFGSPAGFGEIARDFFGVFASRTIRFLAEKELSNHVGPRDAIRTMEASAVLSRDIDRHCRESAEIVREFAQGWYSKANWQTQDAIDRERAEGFLAYALTKLKSEIGRGGGR